MDVFDANKAIEELKKSLAEIRRGQKQKSKDTNVYTFTHEQLEKYINTVVNERIRRIYAETLNSDIRSYLQVVIQCVKCALRSEGIGDKRFKRTMKNADIIIERFNKACRDKNYKELESLCRIFEVDKAVFGIEFTQRIEDGDIILEV